MNFKTTLLALAGIALLGGCASDVTKVKLANDMTPETAINNTQIKYDTAVKASDEVLDRKDMRQALSNLNDAKEMHIKGSEQAKIFDKLGYAEAYLNRAISVSDARRPQVEGLVRARAAAVVAGADRLSSTRKKFADYDDTFNDKIGDLTGNAKDTEDYRNLESNYSNLELQAIKTNHLQEAYDHITKAKEEGAESKAPKSLARAENSVATAENVITGDRHNEAAIAPSVASAKIAASFVLQVTDLSRQKSISESVAVDLANTENSNKAMSQNLQQTKDQLKDQESQANASEKSLRGSLAQTTSEKNSLEKDKDLNDALENSRKQFKPDEAEAFIQGGKLIVRLKQINFPIGKSDLPATSLASLSKVKDVITQLNSNNIVVEGFTDSTGQESMNQKLSEQRASAVATYFKSDMPDAKIDSQGFGDAKPIANNKTKAGRAENRRVDVIITPGGSSVKTTSQSD